MSHQSQRDDDLRGIKAEEILPVKTVGIESLKEANPEVMSPHRKIFRWFARRPTSATRLAILASILPPDISNDKLLKWMQIGPKAELNTSVEDYVLKNMQRRITGMDQLRTILAMSILIGTSHLNLN
jgi:adenine-specific DNA methylase